MLAIADRHDPHPTKMGIGLPVALWPKVGEAVVGGGDDGIARTLV
jgi:hypothetical protein